MVAELRAVWGALERSLEPLSREDQRTVRGPYGARMREAATALCRNLFERKMRDRATGAWPAPDLEPPGDGVVERFAGALARGDHVGAHALLAPWPATSWPAQRLSEEIGRRTREAAAQFALTEPPPADGGQLRRLVHGPGPDGGRRWVPDRSGYAGEPLRHRGDDTRWGADRPLRIRGVDSSVPHFTPARVRADTSLPAPVCPSEHGYPAGALLRCA